MNRRFFIWMLALLLITRLIGWSQSSDLSFIFPDDPERWREEDFENRFKGTYGINSTLEPELDVENFNVYEGVLAFLENREGAIAYIKNAMATMREQEIEVSASLHFLLGNFHYENEDHDLAIEEYITAIHKHPEFLRAYENLGYSFMQEDRNEEALPVMLKAVELGSNDSQTHGLIGFLYLDKELYLSSLTAFEWAMLFNPRNNTWRFGVFQSLVNLGRLEDALGVAEEILLFDPDDPSNWLNLASLLLRTGQEEEGMSHLEVVHQMGGAGYATRRSLGNLYFNRGMVEPAIREFDAMLELSTTPEQLADLLEVCEGLLMFDHIAAAQDLFEKLSARGSALGLELNPVALDFVQAVLFLEAERFTDSERLLDRVLENDPAHAQAILMMAEVHISQNELEEATVYYELAQMYPDVRYDAYYRHAQLLLGQNLVEDALSKLREAQSLNPSEELQEIIRSLETTGRLVR